MSPAPTPTHPGHSAHSDRSPAGSPESGGSLSESPAESPTERLRAETRAAMKAGNKTRVETLRMALAALNQARIDRGTEPDESALVAVAEKMIKQRREAADIYAKAGRDELAEKERNEIAVLEEFLPARLSESEVGELVARAVSDPANGGAMGKIMAALKPALAGRADMGAVSRKVKEALQQ